MTLDRSVEDRLRQEYFDLQSRVELADAHAQVLVLDFLLPYRNILKSHERIEVRCRIKACESSIVSLRNRQEGGTFDSGSLTGYSLLSLRDLVGYRILAFPKSLVTKLAEAFVNAHSDWASDHEYVKVEGDKDLLFMYKYHSTLPPGAPVPVELQVMPMLTGLFSDVEHDALYKPKEQYKGIKRSLEMRRLRSEVLEVLDRFEEGFESYVLRPR